MHDCANTDVRDRLPDYLHGSIEPGARRRVAAHLEACGECRAEAAMLSAARSILRRERPIDLSAISAALPLPPASRPIAQPRAGRDARWGQRRWLRAASALLVVGGAASAVALRERVASEESRRSSFAPPATNRLPGAVARAPLTDAQVMLVAGLSELDAPALDTLAAELARMGDSAVLPSEEPRAIVSLLLEEGA